MNEILRLVTVAEFDEFRLRAMKELGWSKWQFNDRRNGRTKLHPLELRELHRIVRDMHNKNN